MGELRALGEVGQAISSTLNLQTVLSTIVARATQLSGTDAGVIYERRELFEPRATERLEEDIVRALVTTPIRKGESATGQLANSREPPGEFAAEVVDLLRTFATQSALAIQNAWRGVSGSCVRSPSSCIATYDVSEKSSAAADRQ